MDLANETRFAARMLRYQPNEDADVQATLIVKATFERDEGGRWRPSAEQVPIVDDQLETPFGIFHTDCFVRKEGVDICVLGTIRPSRPSRTVQLRLTAGSYSNALTVFGDRKWVRSGRRLLPSPPEPFEEMPLAYARAYGGVTVHDYETATWPDNPIGQGYYLSSEAAEGQPLPNIEPAEGPQIRQWNDQPQVAGWGPYPCFWGMRAREGIELPEKPEAGAVGRIKARLNNQAHSSLIVQSLSDDAEIRLRGLQPQELVFTLPRFSPEAEVHLGDQTFQATGALDGVFLWTNSDRITLTRRIHFTYPYTKGQPRHTRLVDTLETTKGA